ncbi:MAG: cobyric acid synthase [Candidatus Hodgkinia cicadicola]|nr:MAG: cobyric acid synthase [Candidatus Hodgkinia cicadicola]
MLQGTSSNAGKTFLCLCLCKLAKDMGVDVAPFKAQNMTNNTSLAAEGGEVSTAQWLQAVGCGLEASVDMNPIVVRPKANCAAQVFIRGVVERDDYVYPGGPKLIKLMRESVLASFKLVAQRHELVIIEGAGAAAESNLRVHDISNMWLASELNCKVVLVSDVERGGSLASLVGTHSLLTAGDLRLVNGFVLNKFSGRISLLRPGIEVVKAKTQWPCFGVIPWVGSALGLPSEDVLCSSRNTIGTGFVGIILDLPFVVNIDDYNALNLEPELSVVYLKAPPANVWNSVKFVIVPDTSAIKASLDHIHFSGWNAYLKRARRNGVLILGVGAGLQLLSEAFFVKSSLPLTGLGLLKTGVLCFDDLPSWSVCTCELLRLQIKVGTAKRLECVSVDGIAPRVSPLLVSPSGEYGIYNDSVWGVCVRGLLLDDGFRFRFLKMLGLNVRFGCYLNKIGRIVFEAACDVVPFLGKQLLSLIKG